MHVFFILRELMESLVPEVSRVCLDRREMKAPEVSLDPLVPSACRLVPFTHFHLCRHYKYTQTPYIQNPASTTSSIHMTQQPSHLMISVQLIEVL